MSHHAHVAHAHVTELTRSPAAEERHPESPHPDEFRIGSILAPLIAIVFGTFMAILDTTVVNVALPTLERVFQTNLQTLQWVITGYMLAQAAIIPLAGWLSDRFGAKTVYLSALVMFTLGSVLCAVAQTAEMLVVFRVLQGLGGGMLMPVGMSFLYQLAPPEKRGAVMGLFGIPILLAPALGPVISGYLLEYADWRLIFLINLPVGLIAVLFGLRALPDLPAAQSAGALDTLGVVLGPLSFVALSYGIAQSTEAGWTGASTLIGLVLGLVLLVLFIRHELSTEQPLLDMRVFRSTDFTLAMVTSWFGQAAMFGTLFLVPLFLQQVRGYGSFATGLYTLPQAIASAAMMPVAGRLFDRFGARPTVIAGQLLVGAGLWLLSRINATTTGGDMVVPLILWGLGMGLTIMPLNTQVLNAAPPELVSRVTSLSGALFNVIGSLAIAGAATILTTRMAVHTAAAAGPEAAAASFGDVFAVAAGVSIAAAVLALTLRRQQSPAGAQAGAAMIA
jgi:EmrB/QacA subfamily drug resistance transporter